MNRQPGAGRSLSSLRSTWARWRAGRYRSSVEGGLEDAFISCAWEEDFVLGDDRLIIFSDHHKGTRDGADDFWVAERAYNAALGYYLEDDYKLAILGDAEELWENASPDEVLSCYDGTRDLELEFHHRGRGYWRFFGNHDLQWREEGLLARHLGVPGRKARESVKLTVSRDGRPLGLLFLLHGHQGTLFSDRLWWVGKPS